MGSKETWDLNTSERLLGQRMDVKVKSQIGNALRSLTAI